MRGLKHFCLDREHHRHEVASFTDAWIETDAFKTAAQMVKSHLLQMRGLKLPASLLFVPPLSRIFYRCVD